MSRGSEFSLSRFGSVGQTEGLAEDWRKTGAIWARV